MSGIATLTRSFVEAVTGTKAIILDTRKTAPGLRLVDKLAVKRGGGQNHRIGLYDMVLIKDNHIDYAGSITLAIQKARAGAAGLAIDGNISVQEVAYPGLREKLEAAKQIVRPEAYNNSGSPKKSLRRTNP